eukprot:18340-Heterococcus_DN1.PRE.2
MAQKPTKQAAALRMAARRLLLRLASPARSRCAKYQLFGSKFTCSSSTNHARCCCILVLSQLIRRQVAKDRKVKADVKAWAMRNGKPGHSKADRVALMHDEMDARRKQSRNDKMVFAMAASEDAALVATTSRGGSSQQYWKPY